MEGKLIWIWLGGVGLIIGSFLNVVIYRLPRSKSLIRPNSTCPACGKAIKFYDNVPVLSYLFLKGRCRFCKNRIHIQYPLVELFTAFSLILSYVYFQQSPVHTGFTFIFLSILLTLSLIDLEHKILPDSLTLGGAVIFLAYSFFNPVLKPMESFLSAFGAALAFLLIYWFYLKVRKIEGMGQGDIKMMLFLGAFLGAHKIVIATLLASFSGLLVGIFLIIFKKRNLKTELPFGTFLGLGSYISLFWGSQIWTFLNQLLLNLRNPQ